LFAKWQEAVRKDIERAFGVSQSHWQATSHQFLQFDLARFADVMTACLIMQNMCISDRVMNGDVTARYNPANNTDCPELDEEESLYPSDFESVTGGRVHAPIGLENEDNPDVVQNILLRQDHWW